MSLFISSLNSGSNGNCYYVGNHEEAILIDAGISCGEIEKRMLALGLSINKVKAVFVSHEHTDHISGIRVLSEKHKLPVYITSNTLGNCRFKLNPNLVYTFNSKQPVVIGSFSITAFPKYHDACDPYSFLVSSNEINIGVFTDIGAPCENLLKHFKKCHAAFLESNYDETMLENGNYPWFLKNRIRNGMGHLSNTQALELFKNHRPPHMSHLLLSHLSKNNNCPKLVQQLFDRHASGVKMIVAGRYEATEVYEVRNNSLAVKKEIVSNPIVSQLQFEFAFGKD